jgi:alanine dehydrogenase
MIVGVPREVKQDEYRVGLLPVGVELLVRDGHTVLVEASGGEGSGFEDDRYVAAGAKVIRAPEEIWAEADLIVKVKEPQPHEIPLMRDGQEVFTYFHFAADEALTRQCLERSITAIAYETLEARVAHGRTTLPLLTPMSEVAGRLSIQEGTIMDVDLERLRYLSEIMPPNVTTIYSDIHAIRSHVQTADLLIGAVLIPGAKAPKLVHREDLSTMKRGAVIVDVAVDQGGCVDTTRPTTHAEPTYLIDGIVHYCVANMPGAVGRTSTQALTNATLPWVLKLANQGSAHLAEGDAGFRVAINMRGGQLLNCAVGEAHAIEVAAG